MAAGAAAVTVASTAYQIYANEQATKEKKQAAYAEAEIKRQEAVELMERYEINRKSLTKDYVKFRGDIATSTAKAGLDVGSAPLYLLEQINRDYNDERYNLQREATYRTGQLYKEASFTRDEAYRIGRLGRMDSYGMLMQGGAQTANYASQIGSKGKK